jgi:hypothetical protein
MQGLKNGWIVPIRVEKVACELSAVQEALIKMAKWETGRRKFFVDL